MTFNPNQPRIPAGSPTGGEWASGEGSSSVFTGKRSGPHNVTTGPVHQPLDMRKAPPGGAALTSRHEAAIKEWTRGDNYAMRHLDMGRNPSDLEDEDNPMRVQQARENLSLIKEALVRLPPAENQTVYRGLTRVPLATLESTFKVGSELELEGLSSFAGTHRAADKFADRGYLDKDQRRAIISLDLKTGARAADITHLSHFKSEREVLVDKGLRMRVRSHTVMGDGRHRIELEQA